MSFADNTITIVVCKLAINTKPDITIWGFTTDSQCRMWQLRNYSDDAITPSYHHICCNGIVHEAPLDPSSPTLSLSESTPHSVGFDGHISQTLPRKEDKESMSSVLTKRIPGALSVENDDWVEFVDVRGCDAWFEGNGDVVMVPMDGEYDGLGVLRDVVGARDPLEIPLANI
jgi:hypothetical protein